MTGKLLELPEFAKIQKLLSPNEKILIQKVVQEAHPNQVDLNEIFSLLDILLPYGSVDLNSSNQDDVDGKLNQINEHILQAISLKEQPKLNELKANAIDLENSIKNFSNKHHQLNQFRKEFISNMRKLATCKEQLDILRKDYEVEEDMKGAKEREL